ncbi:Maf family protein [Phycisphaeraceae bacterium D3-23]
MTNARNPKHETPYPTLILASQSPRRAQLLRDAGFTITQQSPPYADPDQPEETRPQSLHEAEQYAAGLAMQKALSMVQAVDHPALILSADTLCVSLSPDTEGMLIGKPTGLADARSMITGFMNRAHAVVTGVALLEVNAGQADRQPLEKTLADTAVVTLGHVPDADLERYLDAGDWQGKAGGYNLFDRQTAGWPITVEGDPTTVVGLPMRKFVAALAELGLRPPVRDDR